jgi:RNA polymerase sigma-70 factor, ECF subfamily
VRRSPHQGAADDRSERLYAAHGPAIYARCLQILGERAAAQDAAQDTFLRVHEHLSGDPSDLGSFRWIYRIATNVCLSALRDRRPTEEIGDDFGGDFSAARSSEDRIMSRDLVRRLVLRMPEKLQLPVWLHHVEEIGLEETAAILGVTIRTVTNRLRDFERRGRRFLEREAK